MSLSTSYIILLESLVNPTRYIVRNAHHPAWDVRLPYKSSCKAIIAQFPAEVNHLVSLHQQIIDLDVIGRINHRIEVSEEDKQAFDALVAQQLQLTEQIVLAYGSIESFLALFK